MKPEIALKHEFVEFIPDETEQWTIYVSMINHFHNAVTRHA